MSSEHLFKDQNVEKVKFEFRGVQKSYKISSDSNHFPVLQRIKRDLNIPDSLFIFGFMLNDQFEVFQISQIIEEISKFKRKILQVVAREVDASSSFVPKFFRYSYSINQLMTLGVPCLIINVNNLKKLKQLVLLPAPSFNFFYNISEENSFLFIHGKNIIDNLDLNVINEVIAAYEGGQEIDSETSESAAKELEQILTPAGGSSDIAGTCEMVKKDPVLAQLVSLGLSNFHRGFISLQELKSMIDNYLKERHCASDETPKMEVISNETIQLVESVHINSSPKINLTMEMKQIDPIKDSFKFAESEVAISPVKQNSISAFSPKLEIGFWNTLEQKKSESELSASAQNNLRNLLIYNNYSEEDKKICLEQLKKGSRPVTQAVEMALKTGHLQALDDAIFAYKLKNPPVREESSIDTFALQKLGYVFCRGILLDLVKREKITNLTFLEVFNMIMQRSLIALSALEAYVVNEDEAELVHNLELIHEKARKNKTNKLIEDENSECIFNPSTIDQIVKDQFNILIKFSSHLSKQEYDILMHSISRKELFVYYYYQAYLKHKNLEKLVKDLKSYSLPVEKTIEQKPFNIKSYLDEKFEHQARLKKIKSAIEKFNLEVPFKFFSDALSKRDLTLRGIMEAYDANSDEQDFSENLNLYFIKSKDDISYKLIFEVINKKNFSQAQINYIKSRSRAKDNQFLMSVLKTYKGKKDEKKVVEQIKQILNEFMVV